MKIILFIFISFKLFAAGFNVTYENSQVHKYECETKIVISDYFKIAGKCLPDSDGKNIGDLECIFSNNIICISKDKKNFLLRGSYKFSDSILTINSPFIEISEIKYNVQ